jgi:hypothetical protein
MKTKDIGSLAILGLILFPFIMIEVFVSSQVPRRLGLESKFECVLLKKGIMGKVNEIKESSIPVFLGVNSKSPRFQSDLAFFYFEDFMSKDAGSRTKIFQKYLPQKDVDLIVHSLGGHDLMSNLSKKFDLSCRTVERGLLDFNYQHEVIRL